jgi:hypothetical protein
LDLALVITTNVKRIDSLEANVARCHGGMQDLDFEPAHSSFLPWLPDMRG